MKPIHSRRTSTMIAVSITIIAAVGFVMALGHQARRSEAPQQAIAAALPNASAIPSDGSEAVSDETAADGEMCTWTPVSASGENLFAGNLFATLGQENLSARTTDEPAPSGKSVQIDRAPVRVIHDQYPTYSAVAVDPLRNEIVLQDENLFQIMVFDRSANTPPSASMTEPKRVIGGRKTKVEFNCGLYIDPKSGDIYSVSNDTMDNMVIFSRESKGDVAPTRELFTPHRSYGIAVDEENQELYLTVEYPPQVLAYRKSAQGDEKPLRVIAGQHTRLEDAHGIAIDTKDQWIFVANHGNASNPRAPGGGNFNPPSISVYPLKGNGDVAPLRVISGSQTQLNWPAGLYFDQEAGELYVANDADDSILVFRATDDGDTAPVRVLKGSKTGLKNPTGVFVETKNQEVVVSNMGNHSATVYSRTANGNTAPLRTIRSAPASRPALAIGNPGAVGYDSKRDELLVPN